MPQFIKTQLIDKMNRVEYETFIRPEDAIRRLVAGIRGILPDEVKMHRTTAFDLLPYSKLARQAEPAFCVWWALLHCAGFITVNSLVDRSNPRMPFSVQLVTCLIFLLLLVPGVKQLRLRKIPINKLGAGIGGICGAIISMFLVKLSGNLHGVDALAGTATAMATGILAGAAGGSIVGTLLGMASAVGTCIAAVLTPLFNSFMSRENQNVVHVLAISGFSFGAFMCGLLLSISLISVFRNYQRIRAFAPL